MNFSGNALRKNTLKDFFLFRAETLSPELFRHLTWFHKIAGARASTLTLVRLDFAKKLEGALRRLALIDLPIMSIGGAEDQSIALDVGRQIHVSLPGSEFFAIQSAGHVSNLEQPGELNSPLYSFLRRN